MAGFAAGPIKYSPLPGAQFESYVTMDPNTGQYRFQSENGYLGNNEQRTFGSAAEANAHSKAWQANQERLRADAKEAKDRELADYERRRAESEAFMQQQSAQSQALTYSSPMRASAGAYTPPGGGAAPMVGQTPGSNISQSAYDEQAQTRLQAQLAGDAFQRKLEAIKALDAGGSGGVPRVGAGSNINSNEAAARAAAFARAKDMAGQNGNAAIQALKDAMGSRGLHGSTIENNELANIVGNAGGNVNSYIQQQLMADLNRSADIADRTYAGDITQRGQDLSRYQTLLGLLAGGGSLY